jgi:hypothetical protein
MICMYSVKHDLCLLSSSHVQKMFVDVYQTTLVSTLCIVQIHTQGIWAFLFFKVATSYNKNLLHRHYVIYAFLLSCLYICYRDIVL